MSHPLIGQVAADVATWFELLQVEQGLTFTVDKQAKKFLNEAEEFAAEPSDMAEAADVFISLVGCLWMQNKDAQDLAQAVHNKLAVLRTRTWGVAADGTYQHIKVCEECGNDEGPHHGPDGRSYCLDCLEELCSSCGESLWSLGCAPDLGGVPCHTRAASA